MQSIVQYHDSRIVSFVLTVYIATLGLNIVRRDFYAVKRTQDEQLHLPTPRFWLCNPLRVLPRRFSKKRFVERLRFGVHGIDDGATERWRLAQGTLHAISHGVEQTTIIARDHSTNDIPPIDACIAVGVVSRRRRRVLVGVHAQRQRARERLIFIHRGHRVVCRTRHGIVRFEFHRRHRHRAASHLNSLTRLHAPRAWRVVGNVQLLWWEASQQLLRRRQDTRARFDGRFQRRQ